MISFSARSSPGRLVFGTLGWCAAALALAGVFVPGLPTTVFVLAASWCFSRSSARFERWLSGNRWLGPVLARFAGNGGMSASAKQAALLAMWGAVLVSSGVLAAVRPVAALVTVGLGVVGTGSILFGVRTLPDSSEARSARPG